MTCNLFIIHYNYMVEKQQFEYLIYSLPLNHAHSFQIYLKFISYYHYFLRCHYHLNEQIIKANIKINYCKFILNTIF
jgi:hypothetical protein